MIAATEKPTTIPAEGIHFDVPGEVYHSWDLCSNSALGVIADKSPSHLVWQRANPKDPTDALIIGDAFHTLVLKCTLSERAVN